jgi:hypothetical protein
VKKRQQRCVRGIQLTTPQHSRSKATVPSDAEMTFIASIISPTFSHDVRTPTGGSITQYKMTDKKVDFTVNIVAPGVGEPHLSVG